MPIRPNRCARMCGRTAIVVWSGPPEVGRHRRSGSRRSVIASTGPTRMIPALLIRMSIRPYFPMTRSTIAAHLALVGDVGGDGQDARAPDLPEFGSAAWSVRGRGRPAQAVRTRAGRVLRDHEPVAARRARDDHDPVGQVDPTPGPEPGPPPPRARPPRPGPSEASFRGTASRPPPDPSAIPDPHRSLGPGGLARTRLHTACHDLAPKEIVPLFSSSNGLGFQRILTPSQIGVECVVRQLVGDAEHCEPARGAAPNGARRGGGRPPRSSRPRNSTASMSFFINI